MTKTLTEKFMNNELDDRLYYFTQKMSQDNVEIGHSFEFNMVRADDGEYLDWFLIHEVLDPVPSYSEYQSLKDNCEFTHTRLKGAHQKINQLEKKLEIATKALKSFIPDDLTDGGFGEMYESVILDCEKALKEMDGVK